MGNGFSLTVRRLSVLLLLALSVQVSQADDCEAASTTIATLQAESEQLRQQISTLESLRAGQPAPFLSLADALGVDPLDEPAVRQWRDASPEAPDVLRCDRLAGALAEARELHQSLTARARKLSASVLSLPRAQRAVLVRLRKARASHLVALHRLQRAAQDTPVMQPWVDYAQAHNHQIQTRVSLLPKALDALSAEPAADAALVVLVLWQKQQLEPLHLGEPDGHDLDELGDAAQDLWRELAHAHARLQLAMDQELLALRSAVFRRASMAELATLMNNLETSERTLVAESRAALQALFNTAESVRLDMRDADGSFNWRHILRDLVYLGIMIAGFVVLVRMAQLTNRAMLALHDVLVRRGKARRSVISLSRITTTLAPVLPWVLLWVGLVAMEGWLQTTGHPALIWLVQLAKLYVIYRLLAQLAEWLVLRVALGAGNYLSGSRAEEVREAARRHALVAVVPLAPYLAALVLVGYSMSSRLWGGVALLVFFAALGSLMRRCDKDLVADARLFLPSAMDNWLDRIPGSALAPLLLPLLVPLALLAFLKQDLDQLLHDFDWYRRFSARVLHMSMSAPENDSNDENHKTDDNYQAWFMDPESLGGKFPFIDTGLLDTLQKYIDAWHQDHSEYNTLLMSGEAGIGKTTALRRLQRNLEKDEGDDALAVRYLEAPAGHWQPEQIRQQLEELLEVSLDKGPQSLLHADESMSPTLVIIDNAESFFLSKVGGLDGWQYLLSLTSARVENIFWLISINNQSFAYLSNVFGADYQFANVIQVKRWSQEQIRSLILSRNHVGSFSIAYDEMLLSNRGPESGSLRNAEQRYFSLLWDACRGNPAVALQLWLNNASTSNKHVVAGPPPPVSSAGLDKLGDNPMFVYAALVTHGGLDRQALREVTSLSAGTVSFALKAGLDKGFLGRNDDGIYRVKTDFYQAVISHLNRKNMLNE